jgi:hypothetical protein
MLIILNKSNLSHVVNMRILIKKSFILKIISNKDLKSQKSYRFRYLFDREIMTNLINLEYTVLPIRNS